MGGAAALYAVAAWSVAPGFYDGFAPPASYNFVNPPASAKATNKAPLPGSVTIRVLNGVVQPGSAFTQDAQAQLSWIPGAFEPPSDGGSLVVSIKPITNPPPNPAAFTLVTNVYQFSANARLGTEANLALIFSDQLPAPSTIYRADESGRWTAVVTNQSSSAFIVSARVSQVGLYAAGYENPTSGSSSARVGGGGNQWLPVAVALAILVVILAGIPLAVVRRRTGGDGPPPGGVSGGPPAAAPKPTNRPRPRRRT